MNRKQRQVERYLESVKHLRSQEEQKEQKRVSKEHKSKERERVRKRSWKESDEEHIEDRDLERMHSGATSKYRSEKPKELPFVPVEMSPQMPLDHSEDTLLRGEIVGVFSGRVRFAQDGDVQTAILSEALARTQQSSVAIGDVAFAARREDGTLRIERIQERRSTLSRPDPQTSRERVIAANVDRAVVVVAVRQPIFRPRLFDRYMIALERGGIEPILCANKADLLESQAERDEVESHLDVYRDLGIAALRTSVARGDGLARLRELLAAATSVFVGQSGVGKSSLANAIAPELGIVTGDVRQGDGKGRHTTTTSSLYSLPGGMRLIDTPGIRGFALKNLTVSMVAAYFAEFERFRHGCRFNDCTHLHEPGCAVRDAVEAGAIAGARYATYGRICRSLGE